MNDNMINNVGQVRLLDRLSKKPSFFLDFGHLASKMDKQIYVYVSREA